MQAVSKCPGAARLVFLMIFLMAKHKHEENDKIYFSNKLKFFGNIIVLLKHAFFSLFLKIKDSVVKIDQ